MNEELKNKIESAKNDEKYWNDEDMKNDLIKQGYKKEEIDEVLLTPKVKQSSVVDTYTIIRRIKLRTLLFYSFLGLPIGFILAILSTRFISCFEMECLGVVIVYMPSIIFLSVAMGFIVGVVVYTKRIKLLFPEPLKLNFIEKFLDNKIIVFVVIPVCFVYLIIDLSKVAMFVFVVFPIIFIPLSVIILLTFIFAKNFLKRSLILITMIILGVFLLYRFGIFINFN